MTLLLSFSLLSFPLSVFLSFTPTLQCKDFEFVLQHIEFAPEDDEDRLTPKKTGSFTLGVTVDGVLLENNRSGSNDKFEIKVRLFSIVPVGCHHCFVWSSYLSLPSRTFLSKAVPCT
jgi:hypothetical protein